MSLESPKNIEEWKGYIANVLPTDDLLHQAIIMAKQSFADMMLDEGYNASDLLVIYRSIALRFLKEGLRIPSEIEGSNVNYLELTQYHVPNGEITDVMLEEVEGID